MIYKVEAYHIRSRGSWTVYYIVKADDEADAVAQIAKEEGDDRRVRITAYPLDLSKPVYLCET